MREVGMADGAVKRHGWRWSGAWLVGAAAMAAIGCGSGGSAPVSPAQRAELDSLYAARDYFTLAARLERLPAESPHVRLLRAATQHAFNDPAESNRTLGGIALEDLPDSLVVMHHRLRLQNHLRLHEYAEGLAAARALMESPAADSAARADVRGERQALEALVGVAPQRVVRRGESVIARRQYGRVPLQVGDSSRVYTLDTGANFSVMMASEAEALGLEMRPGVVEVGTVTGRTVEAGVGVARRVGIGEVELESVVFLVLPDAALTFQGGFTIPGLIGFPVIRALGEIRFRSGGVMEVPAEIPERPVRNMVFEGLSPLVRANALGADMVCRLDTGAGSTDFYAPFYRRRRDEIDAVARADTITSTGVGGSRRIAARVLPELAVSVGDTTAVLEDVPVMTEAVSESAPAYLACNLGLDVVGQFQEYVLNFRSMSFLLR